MTDLEKRYFDLSVLGILASKKDVEEYYQDVLNNQTIEEFFIEKENATKEQLNTWKEKYQIEIERIRSTATKDRQEGFEGRKKYLEWYLKQERKCCYCGVKEEELKKYFNENNPQYKNARQRGQYLEIERIVTAPKEKNIYSKENCALACYICNNAKSDFLSPKDFKSIARGISQFWRQILDKKEEIFPEDSDVWSKS